MPNIIYLFGVKFEQCLPCKWVVHTSDLVRVGHSQSFHASIKRTTKLFEFLFYKIRFSIEQNQDRQTCNVEPRTTAGSSMFMRTERMAWVAQALFITCLAKKILSNLESWTRLPAGSSSAVHLNRNTSLSWNRSWGTYQEANQPPTQKPVSDQGNVLCPNSTAPPPEPQWLQTFVSARWKPLDLTQLDTNCQLRTLQRLNNNLEI